MTGLVAFVFVRRSAAQSNLVKLTQQMEIPTVLAVHPETEPSEIHLTLPGTVQAYSHASIYSRVDGYVKSWLVDIGDRVKKGQLLATIEPGAVAKWLEKMQGMTAGLTLPPGMKLPF